MVVLDRGHMLQSLAELPKLKRVHPKPIRICRSVLDGVMRNISQRTEQELQGGGRWHCSPEWLNILGFKVKGCLCCQISQTVYYCNENWDLPRGNFIDYDEFSKLIRKKSESESGSVVSYSLQPHGLYSPWNSLGQNTGVGSLSLLQILVFHKD